MLKIKSKTPTPPPIEEEVVEEQPLEIKVYMDYIGEEGYVYKYNKEKGKYYKSSICLMGPKGNPGIRGPKGDPGAGADVDLSQYASKSYVDDKINDLVNSAPEALDTLGELATKVGELQTIVDTFDGIDSLDNYMPLHGNTGDVDGFKLMYFNGDTEGLPIDLSQLYALYNDDSFMGKNSIIMATSSEDGGGMLLINDLTCLIGNNRFSIGCIDDDIRISTKNGNFVKIYSQNSLLRYPDEPEEGVEIELEPYTILDTGNAKTINGQSLLWDGENENTKNIELVTKTELEQTEEVIATSLTDLDTRINNSIKSIKVNGTSLTPDSNKAVDITVPTVPTISTNITIDATDDTKTASPKAVKTYADSVAGNNSVFIYDINASNLVNGSKTVSDSSAHAAILAAYNAGKAVYIRWTNSAQYPEPIIPLLCYESNTFTFIYNVVIPTLNSVLMYGVTVYTTTVEVNYASNTYYTKPSTGIPASDLANGVIETPVVSHGTNDTTFALTPNVLHTWGTVISLTLTLAMPSDNTIVNEYMFEFQSGSTATTLSLPATVEWDADKGDINIESGYIYQVSILNNLALWGRKEVTS